MRRPFLILTGVLVVGLLVFVASWQIAARLSARHMTGDADDLTWLQQEFSLGDAELERVRELHQAYLPQCEVYCREIAVRQGRLGELLARGALADPEVETTLVEIGEWRARCQANMLRHFQEVAAAMPAEQGRRYLVEMKRLTIDAHETVEQRMSAGSQPAGPGTHVHGSGH